MSDYFERVGHQIEQRVVASAVRPRRHRRGLRLDVAVPALTAVVALIVAVLFLGLRTAPTPVSPAARHARTELVLHVEPTPQVPVTRAVLLNELRVLRDHAAALHLRPVSLRAAPRDTIRVVVRGDVSRAVAERLIAAERLVFSDWEGTVLVPPSGSSTVAKALQVSGSTGTANEISQGSSRYAPGSSSVRSGGIGFYQAVKLASRQKSVPMNVHQQRLGSEYYRFGAPGSPACAAVAAVAGHLPDHGVHCLIAGPVDPGAGVSRGAALRNLDRGIPSDERGVGTRVLVVRQGTLVLEGAPSDFSHWPPFGSPAAEYYVSRDDGALFGNEITMPRASTDSSGAPDVTFGFTGNGASLFQKLTAAVAQRGQELSVGGASLEQHFAIALGNQLVTVPYIDFRTYPDGISGSQGSEISGNFTSTSARRLVDELHFDEVGLRLVSAHQLAGSR